MHDRCDEMWLNLSVSTFVLSERGTVVADTGSVRGTNLNVISLATGQVTQCAVGAGAGAVEDLSIAGGFYSIAQCIHTGSPGNLSNASAAEQLAGHISGSTWLCRGE